jgi:hypothetical protein
MSQKIPSQIFGTRLKNLYFSGQAMSATRSRTNCFALAKQAAPTSADAAPQTVTSKFLVGMLACIAMHSFASDSFLPCRSSRDSSAVSPDRRDSHTENCQEKNCSPTSLLGAEFDLILRQSNDPLLRFLSNTNDQTAASLLLLPAAELKREPLLARLAFEAIKEPTVEQRQALRMAAADSAFGQLALLENSDLPQETDAILKAALAARNWNDGYVETTRRLVCRVACSARLVDGLQEIGFASLVKSLDTDVLREWTNSSAGDRKIIEEGLVLVAASALSISQALPSFQDLTIICRKDRLNDTAGRPELCRDVGQRLEQKSDSMISVLIGMALQKYAADNADELKRVETRRAAWGSLMSGAVSEFTTVEHPKNMIEILGTEAQQDFARQSMADGEIAAMLASYSKSKSADPSVLELIRAVRSAD